MLNSVTRDRDSSVCVAWWITGFQTDCLLFPFVPFKIIVEKQNVFLFIYYNLFTCFKDLCNCHSLNPYFSVVND